MKKILLTSFLIFSSFFGCGIIAQTQVDELGIKNEKDFVKFIKSIAVLENKLSETRTSSEYRKVIKNASSVFTINLRISIDQSGNKLDIYSGDIKVQDLAKYKLDPYYGFSKSKFGFIEYNDLLIGGIQYFTGPGPYSSGASLLLQAGNPNAVKKVEASKSIANLYVSKYIFEISYLPETNENDVSDSEVNTNLNQVGKKERTEEEEEEQEEEKNFFSTNKEVISEQRKKFIEDSLQYQKKLSEKKFITIGAKNDGIFSVDGLPFDKFKIISKPILVSKSYFWQDNGAEEKRNFGFHIDYNPKDGNDTLSYRFYNPKIHGKVYDYAILNGEKVQMKTGEYKNGVAVGEFKTYTISYKNTRILNTIQVYNNEGRTLKFINYNTFTVKDSLINFQSRIFNYDPVSGKMNGLYEEYQNLVNDKTNDFKTLSTPILKVSGMYSNGNRVGEWSEFYQNGKLSSKMNYTTGESETYDEKGELLGRTFKRN